MLGGGVSTINTGDYFVFLLSTKNNAIDAILELVLTRRLSSEVRTFSE